MKQTIITGIIFCIATLCQAQNIHITYDYDYAPDGLSKNNIRYDQMLLNINKEASVFYSLFASNRLLIQDSLLKNGYGYAEVLSETARLPRSYQHFTVYKNYPKREKTIFVDLQVSSWFKYEEPMEQPQWTLQEETKEILDYPCQKAIANFRGRTWT